MSDFEKLEALGQTSIFDFLETPKTKQSKAFEPGDKVRIRFYVDEIEFVKNNHPQWLEVAEVIGKLHDFYEIKIGEITLHVEGGKLVLA